MDFINSMSGLLTPVIAIIAVYVAYQQYQSNKKQGALKLEIDTLNSEFEKNRLRLDEYKLKFDLYNKRYQIFDKTKKILHKICKDAKIDIIELRDFLSDTNESKFLFDKDISLYLLEVKDNAIDLSHFTDELKNNKLYPVNSGVRDTKIGIKRELNRWFTSEYENIEMRFDKYLNLKNL